MKIWSTHLRTRKKSKIAAPLSLWGLSSKHKIPKHSLITNLSIIHQQWFRNDSITSNYINIESMRTKQTNMGLQFNLLFLYFSCNTDDVDIWVQLHEQIDLNVELALQRHYTLKDIYQHWININRRPPSFWWRASLPPIQDNWQRADEIDQSSGRKNIVQSHRSTAESMICHISLMVIYSIPVLSKFSFSG